jgi:hypothetical protein
MKFYIYSFLICLFLGIIGFAFAVSAQTSVTNQSKNVGNFKIITSFPSDSDISNLKGDRARTLQKLNEIIN